MSAQIRLRIVPEYPGLVISSDGRIQGPSGKWLKTPVSKRTGYQQFTYYPGDGTCKYPLVHSVVCVAFHGPRPEGMQVRHLNGDRCDNRADNLRWGTPKENQGDRRAHGTGHPQGSDHPMSKLKVEDVLEIRRRIDAGESRRKISKDYPVGHPTIGAIGRRKIWGHI